jgi:branched-chain amino acid transport system substrate-binding protein
MNFTRPFTLRAVLAALAGALAFGLPASSFAADAVKIGYIGPLSGSLSLLGQGVRDGVDVYLKYINDLGGVNGRKIELIAEDDGYEPMRTVAAAKSSPRRTTSWRS